MFSAVTNTVPAPGTDVTKMSSTPSSYVRDHTERDFLGREPSRSPGSQRYSKRLTKVDVPRLGRYRADSICVVEDSIGLEGGLGVWCRDGGSPVAEGNEKNLSMMMVAHVLTIAASVRTMGDVATLRHGLDVVEPCGKLAQSRR